MIESEFDKVRKKLFAKALSQKRPCLVPDCNRVAIKSHILQRRGVLNHIITNGHLFEVSFLQYPQLRYFIKKTGWKDAMTFTGLCAQHDCSLFKEIEVDTIDFSNYRTMLLLSYRPMLREYRLKEAVREVFHNLKMHPILGSQINQIGIHVLLEAQTLMLWDLEYMLTCLRSDLESDSKHYEFYTFTLPKLDVCTSIIFSVKSLADSFKTFPEMDLKQKEPIANILFHLIPSKDRTWLILGYLIESEKHVKQKIDFFSGLDQVQLLKEISDILIKSCEIWSCSQEFFEKNIKPRQKNILALMNYFVLRKQFSNEKIGLNLFSPNT